MTVINRVTARDFVTGFLAFAVLLSSGCDSSAPITASPTGTIAVDVSTAGAIIDLDSDGYTLSVDGGPAQAVTANAKVTIAQLATGAHLVRLDGVASNCSVAGTNPRSVDVTSDDKAASPVSVQFSVSCMANAGSIRVSSTTLGPDPDPDGYFVNVGGVTKGNLAANGILGIPTVRAGQTQVALSGISGNCVVDGPSSRTVNVVFAAITDVAFTIRCVPQASLGPRAFIWTRESGMVALSMLPGATSTGASAVNDLGQVVGSVRVGNSDRAFLWTLAGGMVDIGGLPDAVASYATAINNDGQVAGYSVDASQASRAFRWSASEGMVALGVLPGTVSSYPRSINSSGQVVGESAGGVSGQHPFRWTPGKGMEDLGLFGPDAVGGASAINAGGDIAGFSSDGKYYGIQRAVLWSANGFNRVIDGCTRGANSYYGCYASANAINRAGEIAGASEANGPLQAFRWTAAGVAQDLGVLPGSNNSSASGINDAGQVVGTSFGSSFPEGHAFLWSAAGGMADLGVLDGKTSSYATGINNSGQVVGTSQ